MENREYQNWILANLKKGLRYKFLYWFADNITRANYADFLWPDKPVSFRAHFMFHTAKSFNGFSEGKPLTAPHSKLGFNPLHCCWCGEERECSDYRLGIDREALHAAQRRDYYNRTKLATKSHPK